ncbi:MAG TPA: hypothetical protein VMW35_08300 [Myxococcota bacterium]|jgi:hypothetical protein|nr:hypothetical protein [Myxococcota bacterium]
MPTCASCKREISRSFHVAFQGETLVFDSFACAARHLAPRCPTCGCVVTGQGVDAPDGPFCSAGCEEEALGLERETLLAADSWLTVVDRARERREGGRVGWILLWVLGVPLPVLLVLYALRGCT